jgi:two-component system cell cycle sensor histidine kinase/response regulator CckA
MRKRAKHLFEPFFTTKAPGKGTGLCLATAYGIVEQSGGTIIIQSAPGQGAIFRMYFPRTEAIAKPGRAEKPAAWGARAGSILLLEDEAPLRKLISRTLIKAGYAVVEAANGEEALAKICTLPSPVNLVFTEVIMPGMSGPEVIAKFRATDPQVTVLYMSGYDRELIDQKTLERNAGFLPKPFTPEILLARIAEGLRVHPESRSHTA